MQRSLAVLQYAEVPLRVQIFGFFDKEKQLRIVETGDRGEIASFIAELPSDDRADLLKEVEPDVVAQLLPLLPAEERRDILRLQAYPEDSAGAVMTTEFARLSEEITVRRALEEVSRQAEELETIYYLYVVDNEDHLRGLVSARQLVSSMGKPETLIGDIMERDLVTVNVTEDQEEVAQKVARFDLMAIPVVDDEYRLMGIITHDDVIDVVLEEAAEDAYRIAAVEPLERGYLETRLQTITWKRGIWLTILFFGALLTAVALDRFQEDLKIMPWLIVFIPLVISTGGNTGNQSATLVITALSTGKISLPDWWRVARRELAIGLLLGGFLGTIGYVCALFAAPSPMAATVIPLTILLVVLVGVFAGSLLPMLFRRLGLDPAMMSNAFVAGLIDVFGIIIYMKVAMLVAGGGLRRRPTMENEFVSWLRDRVSSHPSVPVGIGDDAALVDVPSGRCVVTVDMLTDGVDFELAKVGPRRVGRKALAVNLSDIAAMAAKPVAAFVSIVLPREGGLALARGLFEGIADLASQFGVALAGGDTNSWDGALAISITLLGSVAEEGPLRRDGAEPGNRILATGSFGGSILGKHFDFTPRVEEALLLNRRYALKAGIDVSDGLSLDLARLAAASGCSAELELAKIPVSDDAVRLSESTGTASPLEHALSDGEDFELLFAADPAEARRICEEQPLSIRVTDIGRFVPGSGLWYLDKEGRSERVEPKGWEHVLGD